MSQAEVLSPAPGAHAVRLLGSELRVMFTRWRTWAMLAALAAVPVVIGLAVRFAPGRPPSGRGPAFLDQITDNGLFAGVVGLVVCTPLFLPLTVSVVSGDAIAGEASLGTLRYLLAAPVGRVRLLAVKYLSALVFCAAAALAVVLGGTAVGVVLFPLGKATLLSGTQIGAGESLVRLLLMAAYVTVSLLGLAAIGLFASTLTSVPVGAMAATAVLAVVSQILGALDQLDWLHPWLFTDHWLGLADFLRDPISWDSFGQNAWLQVGYIALFGALAYGRFTTKDILA
ncbi:ABC transporter permease [Sinomonas cyclohexanicum]|uniref:ABC transporter permease n=1 Tax=Sinomonas cyclohexanicum TaxID=322009 RepID=A0ABM7PUJ8_SINCY|nr:ABC transporter permease [Corynebacterium cyclohexanicum]BCT75747.1 ABC transporter permease [Corynebacterium cyclohexanicum]